MVSHEEITQRITVQRQIQKKKQNQRNIADHPQGLNVVTGSMEHNTAATEESNNDIQSVGSLGNVLKKSKLHTLSSVNRIS